jgi:hypothetical protein
MKKEPSFSFFYILPQKNTENIQKLGFKKHGFENTTSSGKNLVEKLPLDKIKLIAKQLRLSEILRW